MIFNAIREIFVKNKRAVNMKEDITKIVPGGGTWLVLNSQYSASRKMYFLFFFSSSSMTVLGEP
jgi:hypothetical protein